MFITNKLLPKSQQTTDGGYIVCGDTESNDGDVSCNHGSRDIWVVKLEVEGEIEWQRCLGGSNSDRSSAGSSVQQTTDGGYIICGFTGYSNDGDVSGNHGVNETPIGQTSVGESTTPILLEALHGAMGEAGLIAYEPSTSIPAEDITKMVQVVVDGENMVAEENIPALIYGDTDDTDKILAIWG